jgi:hypothetical protein
MSEPIHILSLGAGVQSSTMALMAAKGEITPMPTAAIFADTQAEPASVYRWLDWLEKQLPFPVNRVTRGSLTVESLRVRTSRKSGKTHIAHQVPAYTANRDGSFGTWFRVCTDKHKLTPLKHEVDRIRAGGPAVCWIGISRDEIYRMKDSVRRHVQHRWPLVELRMTRQDCLRWMERNGYPQPPRSACVYCPYHSDAEWRRLRDEDPKSFAEAVAYEKALQLSTKQVERLTGIPFLHNSRVPLDQVDFSTEEDRGQQVMFSNECEGMCGV